MHIVNLYHIYHTFNICVDACVHKQMRQMSKQVIPQTNQGDTEALSEITRSKVWQAPRAPQAPQAWLPSGGSPFWVRKWGQPQAIHKLPVSCQEGPKDMEPMVGIFPLQTLAQSRWLVSPSHRGNTFEQVDSPRDIAVRYYSLRFCVRLNS